MLPLTDAARRACICMLVITCFAGKSASEEIQYEELSKKPCPYFYEKRFAAPSPGLINCSWYSNQACCKRTEVTSVFSSMYPLHQATKICRFQMNYLMCYFCSPDQYLFYRDKLMVCSEYCDSLYEDCKTASFEGDTIGYKYQNGTAFCEAQNFQVVEGTNCFEYDPTVFDMATRMSQSSIVTVSLVFIVHFLFHSFRRLL
ncbi:uncharacterized protein [Haliotis asinina]|uniref:uncharacterized protein n=1 Tax=Haliotis asinina TaxID=109174 RepID=UPI0035323725